MEVIEELPKELVSGKVRHFVLLKCKECGIEKKARKDSKQTTPYCKTCSNKTHGDTKTRLYVIYSNMKSRCNNPNNPNYERYGAKGIKISEDWNTYEKFKEWAIDNGYKEDLTLDRIDGKLGYTPLNCRWTTHSSQCINRDFPSGKSGFSGVTTRHIAQIRSEGKIIFYEEANSAEEAAYKRELFILENSLEYKRNFPDLSIEEVRNYFNN